MWRRNTLGRYYSSRSSTHSVAKVTSFKSDNLGLTAPAYPMEDSRHPRYSVYLL